MSGIAGDDVLARMTDDPRQHQHGGPIALQVRKLCERSGIAIDDCARGNAVGELRASKAFERKRAGEGGRSGGDEFGDADAAAFEIAYKIQ